jgi:hypothetical protein
MQKKLKLVSLNIEAHRHLEERTLPFLLAEKPDFVSLQEVFEVDMPLIEQTLGMKGIFIPQAEVTETSIHIKHAFGKWGVAQFTALPRIDQGSFHYVGSPDRVPIFFEQNNPNSMNRVFLWSKVAFEGVDFLLGTTHFTISKEGKWSAEQQRDLEKLLIGLDQFPEIAFSGDFNAPRGGNIFAQLADRYKDNIPADVMTSIDGQFHKAGQLQLMVDGLFTTPGYTASDVKVVDGVSDHKAIVAWLSAEAAT